MIIHEPATLVTDYLLAAFTAVLAHRVWRASRGASERWWAAAFAATAVAGIAGGTVHGFPDALGDAAHVLWLVTIESLVFASFAVVRSALSASRLPDGPRRGATIAFALAYAACGVWTIDDPRFVFAIAAYGSALVVLAAVQVPAWRERPAARWFVAGVVVSAVAAAVQQSGWSLHPHFNHNDLYHVVQAIAVWLLYRGAIQVSVSRSFAAAGSTCPRRSARSSRRGTASRPDSP